MLNFDWGGAMKRFLLMSLSPIILYSTALVGQTNRNHAAYNPSQSECTAKASQASAAGWLSKRSNAEVNELDWELSVCEGKFLPLNLSGALLLAEGHGIVADEFRARIEKAISTLSQDVQTQVWTAFNADGGHDRK